IAGIFAATISSGDAAINSLATISIVDFYKRFWRPEVEQPLHYVQAARWLSIGWGLSATVAALFVGHLGTIFQIIYTINGFLMGPLVGLFLLGLFTRRTNSQGALLGTFFGFLTTVLVASTSAVNYMWYGPISCLATLVIGYGLSLFWSAP